MSSSNAQDATFTICDYLPAEYSGIVSFIESMEPWKSHRMGDDYFKSILCDERYRIKLATINDKIVGLIAWEYLDQFPYGGYIRLLGVDEQCRRRSLGRDLMSHAEKDIFPRLKNAYVAAPENSAAARAFYRACGFDEIGVLSDFSCARFHLIFMRKTIGPVWNE